MAIVHTKYNIQYTQCWEVTSYHCDYSVSYVTVLFIPLKITLWC